MPRPAPIIREANTTQDTALGTGTEVVVATVTGISTDSADERIDLHGWAQVSTGAGVTSITPRIRRGTDATGALVGEGNVQVIPASSSGEVEIDTQDAPGSVAGQSYVLTLTSAGGASTSSQAQVRAIQGAG